MATVRIQKCKGKKGTTYAVKYKDPYTRQTRHYKSFKRFKDANDARNDLRSLIDTGHLPKKRRQITFMTFNEVAESLRNNWPVMHKKKRKLKDKTLYDYKNRLDIVCRTLGPRPLIEISKKEIIRHVDEIAEEFSNVTGNKTLSVIKKVFVRGLELKAIITDVSSDIDFLSEDEHERNEFLLPNQLANLVTMTQKTRAKHRMPAIIYLGAEHGASKQEILSLKWSDIDFDYKGKGLIRFFRTKTIRKRTMPLMPRTKQALLDWKNHLEQKRRRDGITKVKSDNVFCRIDGTPIKNFNKAWWHALDLAGITGFHFHDLRHTYCSNLLLSGSNLKDAKEMIGHADIAMTDRYTHILDERKAYRQEKLAEHYSE